LNNYLLCDIFFYKNRICKQYKFNKLIKKRFGPILYIYYTYNYIYIYKISNRKQYITKTNLGLSIYFKLYDLII